MNFTREISDNPDLQFDVLVRTQDLSRAMSYLAFKGKDPTSNKDFLTEEQVKRINALMLTCGRHG